MALKLKKDLRSGGTAEYWKIDEIVELDTVRKRVYAKVHLYVNAASRQSGKLRVPSSDVEDMDIPRSVSLEGPGVLEAIANGDPRPQLYGVLKALPFFSGSEDV